MAEYNVIQIERIDMDKISENPKRVFKGVWIPKEIWLDNQLTWMEKLFITEINSLDNDNGCYASNNYFAKFFNLTAGRCSQIVKELKGKGYIDVKYQKEGKIIKARIIKIINKSIKNPKGGVVNKLKGGIKNSKGGYLENAKGINIKNNNKKSNNKKNTVANKDLPLYNSIKKAFESQYGNFDNYAKEGMAIKSIIKKAKIHSPDNQWEYIQSVIEKFWELKTSNVKFWNKQPFLPSSLNSSGIWARVLEEMKDDGIAEFPDINGGGN